MKPDFTIKRNYLPNCTQGALITTETQWQCMTLELPNRENERDISCIPEGLYPYWLRKDGKNGICLQIENIVERDAVQVHKGNWLHQILGCILPGNSFRPYSEHGPMVTSSTNTLNELLDQVPPKGYVLITS